MRVYQCEDTPESIFTAVYNAYEDKSRPEDTEISLTEELFLFAEYVAVETDSCKAAKVVRSLRRQFGEEAYWWICLALTSPDSGKAQAVYRTISYGLKAGSKLKYLFDNLSDNYVHQAFVLARNANNEYLHLQGFLRFQELERGIMYAAIAPKNHLVPFLMPHFADRFPLENFVIYDENRGLFGVHPAGKSWYLVREAQVDGHFELSEAEEQWQELFRHFCRKIAIRERENVKLQQNMLPLRFRGNMTEFQRDR